MRSIFCRLLLLIALPLAAAGSVSAQVYPTNYDQYLLELTNWARANPTQAASQYGIDLNEGLPAGTISTDPKQPLAFNFDLDSSAATQSQWMLATDTFSHTGANGNQPNDRMAAAGYPFIAPYTWGENIGWVGQTGSQPDLGTATSQIFQGLFVDSTVPDRGHRINLMDPTFKEVGISIQTGSFAYNGTTYNAAMATQDLAGEAGNSFLTGVAYVNANNANFYNPNLGGYGGLTVTATLVGTTESFTTTTFSSGGYTLQLAPGTYNVQFSGTGVPYLEYKNVTIGSSNVEVDASNTLAAYPWQNPLNPLDVIGSGGAIVPLDAVAIINELNLAGSHALPAPTPGTTIPYYYDVAGTNNISPIDFLMIVNYLNQQASSTATPAISLDSLAASPALSGQYLADGPLVVNGVPEPSSWLMAVMAAGGLAAIAWRRRASGRVPLKTGR